MYKNISYIYYIYSNTFFISILYIIYILFIYLFIIEIITIFNNIKIEYLRNILLYNFVFESYF